MGQLLYTRYVRRVPAYHAVKLPGSEFFVSFQLGAPGSSCSLLPPSFVEYSSLLLEISVQNCHYNNSVLEGFSFQWIIFFSLYCYFSNLWFGCYCLVTVFFLERVPLSILLFACELNVRFLHLHEIYPLMVWLSN